jgi:small-conductance mechanosensitive channel
MKGTDDLAGILSFFRVGGLLSAAVLLLLVWFVAHSTNRFFRRLGNRFTERRLLIHQVGTLFRFSLYIAGLIGSFFLTFRVSDKLLFAIGGSLAVAVGFAVKDLVASIIAGVVILIDRPFQVGDRVTYGDVYGEIRSIGLRSVRLVTLDDNLVTIPNSKFLMDTVSSGNAGELDMLVQMDFFVGTDQDIAAAKRVVAEAITSSRFAYLKKPWSVLVNQVIEHNYFAVRLRAKVYVIDVQHEKSIETDITERVMEGFREARIKPPAVLHRWVDGLDDRAPLGTNESLTSRRTG